MKLTVNLALALTVTILLAVGAIGFADKTQELATMQMPATGQQHKMDDGSTMNGMDHSTTQKPSKKPATGQHQMNDGSTMPGMDMGGM